GGSDRATFGFSNATVLSFSSNVEVARINFDSTASLYTIQAVEGTTLTLSGTGISNSSGLMQEFVIDKGVHSGGEIDFLNDARPSGMTHFNFISTDSDFPAAGTMEFFDSASAAEASFDVAGAPRANGFNSYV